MSSDYFSDRISKVQRSAADLVEAFGTADFVALSALSGDQLTTQHQARLELLSYIDGMVDTAQRDGLDPDNNLSWQGFAALRIVAEALARNTDGVYRSRMSN